jgi:hypothetical protein
MVEWWWRGNSSTHLLCTESELQFVVNHLADDISIKRKQYPLWNLRAVVETIAKE